MAVCPSKYARLFIYATSHVLASSQHQHGGLSLEPNTKLVESAL